jgi:hypothetical protein
MRESVAHEELEFARFVSAQREAGEIVALQ